MCQLPFLPSPRVKWQYGLLLAACVAARGATGQESAAKGEPPTPVAPSTTAERPQRPDDDWARRHLAVDDPLAARETLTLADLDQALADPALRRTVVRHVARAGLEETQAVAFLSRALACDTPAVRREAAQELQRRGKLREVVQSWLWQLAQSDDGDLRNAVIVALETMELPDERVPEAYWQALLAALGSDDPRVQAAAAQQLERAGATSVPLLLDALRGPATGPRRAAAEVLARLLAAVPPRDAGVPVGEKQVAESPPPGAATPPPRKFVPALPVGSPVRSLEAEAPRRVTVYFATNRNWVGTRSPWLRLVLGGLGCGVGIALVAWQVGRAGGTVRGRWRWLLKGTLLTGGLVIAGWSLVAGNDAVRGLGAPQSQSPFGTERDAQGRIRYGRCVVTIPPSHVEGNLEEAALGMERDAEHVTLQRTELREEQAFFDEVRQALHPATLAPQDCLVFVHGYNVTFDKAARRTAQIHFDLQFPGVPLFFSWPSRGNPAEYSADRKEVESQSYRDIQRFLVDVARRTGAPRVHVLAHSMGADAVTRAIRELGTEGQIFDQIILAAPDIDRRVFHDEIAPRLSQYARRTTLYCSRNDRALLLSRYWNSWAEPIPRAGDSTDGPLLVAGTDTVDASTIRTDLLGHSYYGDCVPLLHDVGLLLREGLSPDQRQLEPQVSEVATPDDPRLYWLLKEAPAVGPNRAPQ